MDLHLSEDEQVEQLKKFWKEHGKALIIGVVVGLGGVLGWQSWKDYQVRIGENASWQYLQVMGAVEHEAADEARNLGEALISQYGDTPYAALTKLLLAKSYFDSGDIPAAIGELDWVIKSAKQSELKFVATARKARLQLAQGEAEAALGTLGGEVPKQFVAMFAEIRGDVHVALNQPDAARAAYLTASNRGKAAAYLQMKIENLGEAAAER